MTRANGAQSKRPRNTDWVAATPEVLTLRERLYVRIRGVMPERIVAQRLADAARWDRPNP